MLRQCVKEQVQDQGKQLVLFGCSRGASTTFISVATVEESLLASIRLVILEAPFDSVESVLAASSYTPDLQLLLLQTFTKYSCDQISPLMAADTFPLHVPVAFITSEIDTRVPRACTQRLIDRLRERGHRQVHHLALKNSGHNTMSTGDPDDVAAYVNFVNELYKLYIV
jgi:alpha-beta hydrolase superfamily lysophospholipase